MTTTPNQPGLDPATTPQRPQVVYVSRPLEPLDPHISDEVRKRHEDSKAAYPVLNLSEGEYVISAIRRHPIGLFSIWAIDGLLIILINAFIPLVLNSFDSAAFGSLYLSNATENAPWIIIFFILLAFVIFLGGVIATVVYNANRFFLTNESVVQHIQISLFSKKEQTISLANIEDASFRQHGIVQHILNYGSLRLSTEGDETTYRFSYVSNPQYQVNLLNNAVEAFKNGRPVNPDENN